MGDGVKMGQPRLHRETAGTAFNWIVLMDSSSPIQLQHPKPLDVITTEGEEAFRSLSSELRERWDIVNSDSTRAEIMRLSGQVVDYVVGLINAGANNRADEVVGRYHGMLAHAEYFK